MMVAIALAIDRLANAGKCMFSILFPYFYSNAGKCIFSILFTYFL